MAPEIRRRDVLKLAALATASATVPFADASTSAAPQTTASPQSTPAAAAPAETPWQAQWIYYPGQRAAHLRTVITRTALERNAHVGYPGSFQLPQYSAYFRLRTNLASDCTLRWTHPAGRARVRVNGREGDVTINSRSLTAGPVEILVQLDMMLSLPCFLLEGANLSTGAQWEASLDNVNWRAAEVEPGPCTPSLLPDRNRDVPVPITSRKIARLTGGAASGSEFHLATGGLLLIDFDVIEIGTITFTASGSGPLRLNVGESDFEALDTDPTHAEQYPLPPYHLTARAQTFTLPERAIRYLAIRADGPSTIHSVSFTARKYPFTQVGSFQCSDARLNQIFQTGIDTVRAIAHNSALFDGTKRDALLWLEDENIDYDACDCLFFDSDVLRNTNLSQTMSGPIKPGDVGMFDLLPWYLMGFEQDYSVRADADFIRMYQPEIMRVLDFYELLQDSNGIISAQSFSPKKDSKSGAGMSGVDYLGVFYPDWTGVSDIGVVRPTDLDCAGAPTYAQMMVMRGFEVGAQFALLWNDPKLSARYAANAARMRKNIVSLFWDSNRNAFINGLHADGSRDERLTSFGQVWGMFYDLVPDGHVDGLFTNVLENPACRARNYGVHTYWEYRDYIKHGRFTKVLEFFHRIWGGQLDDGFIRFVEDVRPGDSPRDRVAFYGRPYGMSLNHGWGGATAVTLLMKGSLGLEITEPGYKSISLTPNWTAFDWVKITLPTPLGKLAFDYDKSRGASLTVPAGITVTVAGKSSPFTGPGTLHIA